MSLVLRQLVESDEAEFFEGLQEWSGDDLSWYTVAWKPGMTYAEMLSILSKENSDIDLPEGRVPATMFYGFVEGKIVGRLHVRHRLNNKLRLRGGHLGYAITKKFRKRGYASDMFEQALPFCSKIGICELMITCGDENVASWKIIERFNGKLEDKIWDNEENEMIRRYWIKL